MLTGLLLGILVAVMIRASGQRQPTPPQFDGERALQHVVYQVNLGPRTIGSEAHRQTQAYIQRHLESSGWVVRNVSEEAGDITVHNIVGEREAEGKWILLGAHYDSRLYADREPDPALRKMSVPGANDGASGVGVLLELATVIPERVQKRIWLVFFDAEDNGNITGWDWIMGSRIFASQLKGQPDAVVIVDMVGDKDLNLYIEKNSHPELVNEIWTTADEAGFAEFIPVAKYRILDDHIPFIELGIPSVDIIDFDYPYWHTTQDTLDKVSATSLEAVGETLLRWILR